MLPRARYKPGGGGNLDAEDSAFVSLLLSSSAVGSAQERSVPADSPEGKSRAVDEATPQPTANIRYGTRPLNTGQMRIPRGKGPSRSRS